MKLDARSIATLLFATGAWSCTLEDDAVDERLAPGLIRLAVKPAQPPDPGCPPPTRSHAGDQCVLDGDVVIEAPLVLPSSKRLNCRGHKIVPKSVGRDAPSATGYLPSVPEVAVALIGARDAVVQSCIIGTPDARIDFGVVVLASKLAPGGKGKLEGNKILGNEIHVRAVGVSLLAADENLISDNLVTWDGSGIGLLVDRDADRNKSVGNTFTGSARALTWVRVYPGTNARAGNTPDVGAWHGDDVTAPVRNIVIGKRLVQLTNLGTPRVEDNVFEDNVVTLPGSHVGKERGRGGIYVAVMSSRTVVRGNVVIGGRPGIRQAGGFFDGLADLPARCIHPMGHETTRYCATDADCHLDGIDDDGPIGTCPDLEEIVVDSRALYPVSERNTLYGPFGKPNGTELVDAAIGPFGGSSGAVLQDNVVFAEGTSFGISMQGDGIVNMMTQAPGSGATIRRNTIIGARHALALRHPPAALRFGARIYQNDFVDSIVGAVTTIGPTATASYGLPTELSVDGVGNHWGHASAPGFRATDSTSPLVTDTHPYCEPVASLTSDALPATCP